MLQNLLTAILLMLIAAPLSSAQAGYEEITIPHRDDTTPVPWPWSRAQPFPWTDVQGLWKLEQDEYSTYFSLKVIKQKSGTNHLQIKQFDGETCRILATGVGIERGSRVLAQMSSRYGVTYRVQFTTFSEKDSPLPKLKSDSPSEGVMVLSIGALDSEIEMLHVQIARISPFISQKFCREDVKSNNY